MSNPYLPRIGPAIGGGLPGIPQRAPGMSADPNGAPLQIVVLRLTGGARQPYITPGWATYARVTTLGRGGQGCGGTGSIAVGSDGAHGGGGGGIAASLVEAIPPETLVDVAFTSTATIAVFLNYLLSGGNGGDAQPIPGGRGPGGIGSGGAINFSGGAGGAGGGSGSAAGGGGAAGRGGAGQDGGGGVVNAAGNSGAGDLYATGGGAGGGSASVSGNAKNGGISITTGTLPGAALIGKSTSAGSGFGGAADLPNCNGGDGGGGSGGSIPGTISNVPGAGLVLIELW